MSFLSILATTFLLTNEGKHKRTSSELAKRPKPSVAEFFKHFAQPKTRRLFLEIFFFFFSFSAYVSGFALFAERRFTFNGSALDARQIGYAFAYFGLLGIIIQTVAIGPLVKKFGERRLATIGFLSSFIGYLWLGLISQPLLIMLTGLFTSFGAGVLRPTLTSEIAGSVEPRERGAVMGMTQSIQSIAQIVAPMVSTFLIAKGMLIEWAFVPAMFSLAGATLLFLRRGSQ